MIVKLYRSDAEITEVDKTSHLTFIKELNVTLKAECDIVSPVLLFKMEDDVSGVSFASLTDGEDSIVVDDDDIEVGISTSNNMFTANYAFIREFNRWYFITAIQSVRDNLWRLSLRVDVLMTYKGIIRNHGGIIARNEFDYNLLIEDSYLSYRYDLTSEEHDVENVTGAVITELGSNDPYGKNTAVTIICTDNNFLYGDQTKFRASPDGNLPRVSVVNTAHSLVSLTWVCNWQNTQGLLKEVAEDQTLATFIVNVVRFPFELASAESVTSGIPLGDSGKTFGGYQPLSGNAMPEYHLIAKFELNGETGTFLDYEPYSTYELYIPYVGWIDLSAVDCLDSVISVYYVCDYATGNAQVLVINETTDKLLYVNTSQIGVSVPVSTTTAYETDVQRLQNTQNLITGILGGVGKATGGFGDNKNGNIVSGAVSGGSAIGGAINNYITSSMLTRVKANAVMPSGCMGLYAPQKCRLRIGHRHPTDNGVNYNHVYGRPLNEYRTLSDLHGFTIVGDIHLKGFDTALKVEVEEIYSLLKTGVIL